MKQLGFRNLCFSVSALFALVTYCYSNAHTNYGRYEHGICPPEKTKFREFVKISIYDCVKKCAVRKSCKILGYKRKLKTCSLHLEGSEEFVNYNCPESIQIKMETVNISQFVGDCKCAEWQVCDVNSGLCRHEECEPLQNSVTGGTVLGNIDSVESVKRIQCMNGVGSDLQGNKLECLKTGKWTEIPNCVENIALQKTATMSSVYKELTAGLALDGDTNNAYSAGSCFHTNYDYNPWWRVDLGVLSYIEYVILYNRFDGQAMMNRAHDIVVEVGNTVDTLNMVAFLPGPLPLEKIVKLPKETHARILKLSIKSTSESSRDYFHLCEVEIYGAAEPNFTFEKAAQLVYGRSVIRPKCTPRVFLHCWKIPM